MLLIPKTIALIAALIATIARPRIGLPIIERAASATKIPKIKSKTQLPTFAFLISNDRIIIVIPSNRKPKPQMNHKKLSTKAGLVNMQIPAIITKMCRASLRPQRWMYFLSTTVIIAPPTPETRK